MTTLLPSTRRPEITFHRSGRIDISSRVVKALGIADGDVLNIINKDSEFFLYVAVPAHKVNGCHSLMCHPSKKGGRHMRTWSRKICDFILKHCCNTSVAALPVGEIVNISCFKAIQIITSNNLHL